MFALCLVFMQQTGGIPKNHRLSKFMHVEALVVVSRAAVLRSMALYWLVATSIRTHLHRVRAFQRAIAATVHVLASALVEFGEGDHPTNRAEFVR